MLRRLLTYLFSFFGLNRGVASYCLVCETCDYHLCGIANGDKQFGATSMFYEEQTIHNIIYVYGYTDTNYLSFCAIESALYNTHSKIIVFAQDTDRFASDLERSGAMYAR